MVSRPGDRMSKIRRCRIIDGSPARNPSEHGGDILIQQRSLVISRDCALAKQTPGVNHVRGLRDVSLGTQEVSLVSANRPDARPLANGSSGAQCTHEHTGRRSRTVRSRCGWIAAMKDRGIRRTRYLIGHVREISPAVTGECEFIQKSTPNVAPRGER